LGKINRNSALYDAMFFIFFIAFLYTPLLSQPNYSIEENRFFRFYFQPKNTYIASLLMEKSEDYLKEISSELNFQPEFKEKIVVYILPSRTDLKKGEKKYPLMPNWVVGFADTKRGIIMLRSSSTNIGLYKSIFDVFKHELSHIILKAYLGKNYSRIPWWFIEGLAMWQAKEWSINDSIFLSESLIKGSFLPLREMSIPLNKSREEARQMYTESLSFFLYLRNRFGFEFIREILSRVKEGQIFEDVFQRLTHQKLEQVEDSWRRGLNFKYKWLPIISSSATLWLFISLLFLISYARKKKKEREILKKWEKEDFFC